MKRRRNRRRQTVQPDEIASNEDKGLHYGPTPPHDPLNKTQSQQILKAVFELMRETGVEFEPDPKVLSLFRAAGCDVSDTGLVKFPANVVQGALDSMAKSVKLWNRPATEFIEIDNRHT
ncbi:MAG: hypothetical protein GY806_12155, partial [Gammaproteobacteria bacterium]|nr:hypothetical protein [Gammaproteobacteria bacterium]